MNRRHFLSSGLALGCSLAASPLVTPMAFASAPTDNRLVVIILRGGMDGLDVIRPLGDRDLRALRPGLTPEDSLSLEGFWGLHPALAPLMPLWRAGEFGAVHAVSTPYRDKRSHFDGQDVLEAGQLDIDGGAGGWLNRLLTTIPGAVAETAYAIGREQMAILSGPAPALRWSPDAVLDLSPQARRLLELVHHDDPLFREASAQAIAIAEMLSLEAAAELDDPEAMSAGMTGGMQPNRVGHVDLARFAAARLRAETRIASFSLTGWDTHQNQNVGLRRALEDLSETILTLKDGLGAEWRRTAVLCMTEFGRTARENGTKGTDHGTGGALLYAGGALKGGQVAGRWPGLSEADLLTRRDLMPTDDLRAPTAWVLRGLLGTARSDLEQVVFPGLDMGSDPGLVAG